MNKVFINEEGIIEEVFIGRQTFKKVATTFARAMVIRDKLKKEKKELKVLVDLTKLTSISADALVSAADAMKTSFPTKSALFGGSKVVNSIASLLIAATGKDKEIMLFETRNEAVKWLGKR